MECACHVTVTCSTCGVVAYDCGCGVNKRAMVGICLSCRKTQPAQAPRYRRLADQRLTDRRRRDVGREGRVAA
jgi:hypothetical protein